VKRTLSLKSETLAELSTTDLAGVAGAAATQTCGLTEAIKETLSMRCPGWTYSCPDICY
jgi:hypothetical protein